MKTHHEIHLEARRIEETGRRFADQAHQRRRESAHLGASWSPPASRVLFSFPVTQVSSYRPREGADEALTRSTWRWIEGAFADGELQYVLVEQWAEIAPNRGVVDQVQAYGTSQSAEVEDLLVEGYRQVEEEVLAERLGAVLDRVEADSSSAAILAAAEEVETLVESEGLSPAEWIRTKIEIVALLDGRLEVGEFIETIIDRQSRRGAACESLVERQAQRLLVGEP